MTDLKKLFAKNPAEILKSLTAKPKEDKRPAERRTKLLAHIDAAIAAHKKGTAELDRTYKPVGDTHIQYTPRAGSRIVTVSGERFDLVERDKFGEALTAFRAHVEGGGFDADIARAFDGGEGRQVPSGAPAGARGERPKRIMSEEQRAKIAEAQRRRHAERKAAQGK